MMQEFWTVTHNLHPSGKLETVLFPKEQPAWILWVQLIGEAWEKWYGRDPKLYPGGDAAALILEAIPGMLPYQVKKTKHLIYTPPPF